MNARGVGLHVLGRARHGELCIVEPAGTTVLGRVDPENPLRARVKVHDQRAWRALLRGSRGIAASYMDGAWESADLVPLIRIAARNAHRFDRIRDCFSFALRPWQSVTGPLRRNTESRARKRIAAHYDLGNELFATFLDPTLMYSSAIFPHRDATLEAAQLAKLDHVCRKLGLGPDDHLLEIGTGWGSMAMYATTRYGCRVTTTTISAEQHAHARARVRAAGLEDRVTVLRQDYRQLTGTYDKLVSIEMIEAVGWQHFGTFFATCSRLLAPQGAMLLQAITIDDRAYQAEKATRSFIKDLIFPGGCLPSQQVISRCVARRTDMRPVHLDDISEHYCETLRHWRERFLGAEGRLEELGYDARFRRLWELYLAYCEAGFRERRIQDIQLLLGKPAFRAEPMPGLAVPPPLAQAAPVAA